MEYARALVRQQVGGSVAWNNHRLVGLSMKDKVIITQATYFLY